MKTTILAILILITQVTFSQSKGSYLKNNRSDLLSPQFEFPQTNFKIIGFGAYHGSQATEKAEHILLEKLLSNKKISYYLPETDYSIAHYFNEYLKSGDTILLKDLVKHYGIRVPQEKSIETYNKWKGVKAINDRLPENDKLKVIGIDYIVSYKYTCKQLLELFPLEKGKLESYDKLVEMVQTDTTDYSPYYNSYSKKVLKAFVKEYESAQFESQQILKDKAIFDYILQNISLTFVLSFREEVIYNNYVALSKIFDFNTKPQFLRMGFFHIEKHAEGDNSSFFAQLIENKIYAPNEVISIAGFLTKSRVLWEVKYNEQKEYASYSTEGGYGIGDYWKEYFKGIRKLKRKKISDLTLFSLNKENSPYQKGTRDLMEIKLFLKKSNKKDLKGTTTTDFFDYALLMSHSEASKPIEELK